MKAIILAAGKGARLRPLTYGIPKPLLPVKGKPVLDWVINNILKCKEVDEIIVGIPGTTSEDFQERILAHTHGICVDTYLKNNNYAVPVRTVLSPQRETAGDLRFILEEAGINSGSVLVAYGDGITSIDTEKMSKYHKDAVAKIGASATVALFHVENKDLHRMGIAKTTKKGGFDLIKEFVEKPKNPSSNLANAGYYILEIGQLLPKIPQEKIKMEQSVFPELAAKGKLAGYVGKLPFWIDIGTVEAYETANKMAHEGLIIAPPTRLNGDSNANG